MRINVLVVTAVFVTALGAEALARRLLGANLGRTGVAAAVCVAAAVPLDVWFHQLMRNWRDNACFKNELLALPAFSGPVLAGSMLFAAAGAGVVASALPLSVGWRRLLISLTCALLAVYFFLDELFAGACSM